jgi:hypothetical protein
MFLFSRRRKMLPSLAALKGNLLGGRLLGAREIDPAFAKRIDFRRGRSSAGVMKRASRSAIASGFAWHSVCFRCAFQLWRLL